jgi:hypothetical protein
MTPGEAGGKGSTVNFKPRRGVTRHLSNQTSDFTQDHSSVANTGLLLTLI